MMNRARTLATVILQHTPAAPRLPMPHVPDPPSPRSGRPGLGIALAALAVTQPDRGIPVAGWTPGGVARFPSRWP